MGAARDFPKFCPAGHDPQDPFPPSPTDCGDWNGVASGWPRHRQHVLGLLSGTIRRALMSDVDVQARDTRSQDRARTRRRTSQRTFRAFVHLPCGVQNHAEHNYYVLPPPTGHRSGLMFSLAPGEENIQKGRKDTSPAPLALDETTQSIEHPEIIGFFDTSGSLCLFATSPTPHLARTLASLPLRLEITSFLEAAQLVRNQPRHTACRAQPLVFEVRRRQVSLVSSRLLSSPLLAERVACHKS